jgi:hypothetical protein
MSEPTVDEIPRGIATAALTLVEGRPFGKVVLAV